MKQEWPTRLAELLPILQKQKDTYRSDYGYRRCDEWIPFKHRNRSNPDSGSYWNCSEVRVFPFQIVNAFGFCSSDGR